MTFRKFCTQEFGLNDIQIQTACLSLVEFEAADKIDDFDKSKWLQIRHAWDEYKTIIIAELFFSNA